jgi:hypothetical protein
MSQDEIKSIFKKYKRRAVAGLGGFLICAIFANWYLINSSIERNAELGLSYTSSDPGFILGIIIMGLYTVLYLCFYYFEKILLKILSHTPTKAE